MLGIGQGGRAVHFSAALYTHEIEAIISPWYQPSYGNELRNRDGIYYEGRVVHTPQANGTVPQTS